jgi:hypothetical protein
MSQDEAKAYVDFILGNVARAASETTKTAGAINKIKKK